MARKFLVILLAALAGTPVVAQPVAHPTTVRSKTLYIDVVQLEGPAGIPELAIALRKAEQDPAIAEARKMKGFLEGLQAKLREAVNTRNEVQEERYKYQIEQYLPEARALNERALAAYDKNFAEFVKPVMQRLERSVSSFSDSKGRADVRLVEPEEAARLEATGAKDATVEFSRWYQDRQSRK